MRGIGGRASRWVWAALLGAAATAGAGSEMTIEEEVQYEETLLIQLTSSDVTRSIEFYRDVLGFELESYDPELDWARIQTGIEGVTLGIGSGGEAEGSGSTSLNFGVKDVPAARRRLEARGVRFDGPTLSIPGVVRLASFRDPDGNRIRLADHPPDATGTPD